MPPAAHTDQLPSRPSDRARRERSRQGQPESSGRRGHRREERVLGEGFHGWLGGPHAEVAAIDAAAEQDLAGATMYVSLEPCCHHGRTPPCTDAIRRAGIGRVVVASDDPSEHASGRGLGILRDEGIEVVVADGELAHARPAAQPAVPQARAHRAPLGAVQVGDDARREGRHPHAATRSGSPASPAASCAHHWRAECDAVAVGIGTALADDPQLTARFEGVDAPAPPRGVRLAGPAAAGLQARPDARRIPLTVVVSRAAPRAATDALQAHGADVIVATGENEPARVRSALDQLGAVGVGSILLEGGPHLAGAFLDAGRGRRDPPVPGADRARRARPPATRSRARAPS